ncbi:hypothetical protein E3N88_14370 [Mikania micrantha]|uniref:Uncharacterized protein n=1 Tax=Mikania micrantha TaxID=192012 RepID=A0A5N6P178_9ASTR|nr:hypothetical protein E3N88_14370 [Mikania micrantha]
MGMGIITSIIAMVVAAIVELIRRSLANSNQMVDMSAMWLVPQFALIGITEALNGIGQMEFYYSELPKSMASSAMAIFAVSMTIAALVASLLTNIVDSVTSLGGGSRSGASVSSDHADTDSGVVRRCLIRSSLRETAPLFRVVLLMIIVDWNGDGSPTSIFSSGENLKVSIFDGEVGPSLRFEISPISRAIFKHKHKNLDRVVSLLQDMREVGTNYFMQELKHKVAVQSNLRFSLQSWCGAVAESKLRKSCSQEAVLMYRRIMWTQSAEELMFDQVVIARDCSFFDGTVCLVVRKHNSHNTMLFAIHCKHKHQNLDRGVSLLQDTREVGTSYFMCKNRTFEVEQKHDLFLSPGFTLESEACKETDRSCEFVKQLMPIYYGLFSHSVKLNCQDILMNLYGKLAGKEFAMYVPLKREARRRIF